MKNTFYILIVFCLAFSACSEPYYPEINEERKIVIDCALAPGINPLVRVHITNAILDTAESFNYPTNDDAVIFLMDVNDMDRGRISWDGSQSAFVSESTPIVEGATYEISVSLPGKNVDSISAITTVPFAETLETVNAETIVQPVGDFVYYLLNVQVEIPAPSDPTTFYQLIAEVKNAELASTGVVQYDQLSKDDIEVLTNQNGIKEFIHKNGIFIDNSRIDDNTVDLMLRIEVPAQYISFVDSVTFTLNTVNQEFMVYHENTDRELRISALPLDEPQISATNIQNGYGLFGAYSSSKLTIPIE